MHKYKVELTVEGIKALSELMRMLNVATEDEALKEALEIVKDAYRSHIY